MKLKPFLLFLFMFGNSIVNSAPQEKLVKGSVTDAITGDLLYGVNIIIEGTQIGISTDLNGKFSLPMPANGSILIFSFVGYGTEKVTFTGQAEIDIKLSQVVTKLDDIVVVGYGAQSKRDISGSVANVTEKNFNKGVSQDAIDLIQGKVAGLVVTKAGGDVTDSKTVRLRGISSLTGSSEPFVVIDGIPGLSINSVTPENIESISILKDASAAAIYGSRSASGVILITTKNGMPGKTNV